MKQSIKNNCQCLAYQTNCCENKLNANSFCSNILLCNNQDNLCLDKVIEDNKKLLFQNQNLNQKIKRLNDEINNLNQLLNQTKCSNNDLQEKLNTLQNENRNIQNKIIILQSSNDDLQNKLNFLSIKNEELNNLIGHQGNHLNINIDEKNTYINEIKKLNELLEKYKSIIDNNLKDKEESNQLKNLYLSKYQENEREKDNLLLKNNYMNDILIKNQAMLDKLNGDNLNLNKKRELELQNKNSIIKDLRKQVDFLKDDLSKSNDDQIKLQDYYSSKKISNEKKIDDLTGLLEKLSNEKENLNKNANENKRLNDKLIEEKKMILDKFNFLSIALKNDNIKNNKKKKKRFDSPPKKGGFVDTSDISKTENYDLNQLVDKLIQMLDILIKFINDLNDLYNHPKININSVGVLIEDINLLKKDILDCFEAKEKENYNKNKLEEKKKWKEMKTKLYNNDRPYMYNEVDRKKRLENQRQFISEYRK